MVDSWSCGLDRNQVYPDRDKLSNVPRSGYITARDQSMVESGVTEGGKNTANFTNMKPQAKKQRFLSYPRRETATSGGKRCR